MTDPDITSPPAPIAIVGISCRLPGHANSPEKLWELLERAGEAWTPVPADRYNESAFYHPNGDDPNGTNNHRGGHFIDGDLSDFDHSFFRVSPQQASAMDPQQRILLEMTYEAIEIAGLTLESCSGSNTAVYAASFTADFERNLYRDPLNMPLYYLTGVEKAILSNRISHAFDLHGPSMTIDTGCSGGLVAMHQACHSLRNGESDVAIVASANLTLGPDHHIGMSTLHLTSGAGRSYPFDSRGDGYGRGEGCVVLVLKRLDKAIRDHDPIRAVIRNTAVNQDGYTAASITYPNGVAQEQLIRDTYARAGLSPMDVPYVEAHGTGTQAGDLEELTAISKVFTGSESGRPGPLYVGSIKGNVGHSENTSGLSSIVKATLILERLHIPPTAGLRKLKAGLPLEQISIPTELVPWPQKISDGMVTVPPRVSINSFGFGGANAHAILEEAPQPSNSGTCVSRPYTGNTGPRLFTLSASSQESLSKMIVHYHDWVESHPQVSLHDLAYTLCCRRSILSWRFSCVAWDQYSLMERLQAGMIAPGSQPVRDSPELVFVFSGQGAQWLGMGRELMAEKIQSPFFRVSIRASRDILRELGADWDLEVELLHPPGEVTQLNSAELAQPATTAIQIALVDLLRTMGVHPGAVIGHSSGEIAAAYAAGHLTARQAMTVAYHRGFMATAAKSHGLPRGAMLSVGLSEAEALPFIKNLSSGEANIACVNSPKSVTISGDAEAIDEVSIRLSAALDREGGAIFQRRLLVDTAYHSHHMRAVAKDYWARLQDLKLDKELDQDSSKNASVKAASFFSSVSGTSKSSGFDAEYWTANLVSPVRFSDAIQTIANAHASSRHTVFVEIGPHSALAGPVRQCLTDPIIARPSSDYLSVLKRDSSAVISALAFFGRLFELGVKLSLSNILTLSPGSNPGVVIPDLPKYPWDHSQKHLFESRISREYRMRRDPYHDLLGARALDATSIEPRWRHMISLATLPWLEHHIVDSQVIFPGSGYICMAIEAVMQMQRERHPESRLETLVLKNISFPRALVVPGSPQRTEMQLSLTPQVGTILGFNFRVTALSDGKWFEHCTGLIEGLLAPEKPERVVNGVHDSYPLTNGHSDGNQAMSESRIFNAEEIYRALSDAGNTYGPTFAGIRHMSLSADVKSGNAAIEIPNTAALMPAGHQEPHLIHPTTLDILLHTCLPLAAGHFGPGSIMPVHIDELHLLTTAAMPSKSGTELHATPVLKSSHFRTAYADLSVAAGGETVLLASGIELRSLAPQTYLDEGKLQGICYDLEWRPDVDFFSQDSPAKFAGLAQVFRAVNHKYGKHLRVLEIGTRHSNLSLAFLGTLDGPRSTWPLLDFGSTTPESLDQARRQLTGYPVRYHSLSQDYDLCNQGLDSSSYDLVLTSSIEAAQQASILVKSTGIVVVESAAQPDGSLISIFNAANLEMQQTSADNSRGSWVIAARPSVHKERPVVPEQVQILTHSRNKIRQSWASSLEDTLRSSGVNVSREPISAVQFGLGLDIHAEDGCTNYIVVLEDESQPILSDPQCFNAVAALLRQPCRIIWVSPEHLLPMHQITGVARTAHAENATLRLTTVHVAPELLSLPIEDQRRLQHSDWPVYDIFVRVMELACRAEEHVEREYRVDKAGAVLVPRLRHSLSLNNAVHSDPPLDTDRKVVTGKFVDSSRTLSLASVGHKGPGPKFTERVVFHETALAAATLAEDEIAIETQAFVLSTQGPKAAPCVYSGSITKVGAAVSNLSIGGHVIAIGSVQGANRLRVSCSQSGLLPSSMSPAVGAGVLIDVLAACYSLQRLAHLSPRGKILIHGALSNLGRAVVAVSRSIGARIGVTAANISEASVMASALGIPLDEVIILTAPYLRRGDAWVQDVDVIVQTGTGSVPDQVLARLKPFGSVVVVTTTNNSSPHSYSKSAGASTMPMAPRNSALFFCDIIELFTARPDLIPDLMTQSITAMEHFPVTGMDLCVRPVAHVDDALRLISTGSCDRIVLQVEKQSTVSIMALPTSQGDAWTSEDACYVIAGGLGDLGIRLLHLMARRGAKHLVTLSRRFVEVQEQHRIQAQLQELSPGCKLYCLNCDLTVEESVKKAAATLASMGVPPVRGIVHSAALLQDRTLDSMTHQDFLLASQVKVDGTSALESVFTSPHLEFFLMLSSAVNIVGASGQANYNAGNSVQDALAYARQDGRCRYMSLSIGWIEDAVHTADDEARLNGLRRAGLRAITHDELSRYLDHALEAASGGSPQAIIGFDATSLSAATAHNGTVRSALFSHVRGLAQSEQTAAGTDPSSSSQANTNASVLFAQAMARDDLNSAVEIVSTAMASQLARMISIDSDRINPHATSMLALGVDSLVSIELRNWTMREFDAPLQTSEILVDQTIHALADKVISRSRMAVAASVATES